MFRTCGKNPRQKYNPQMTSISRSFKQTPSNFLWSHGADLWSMEDIKAAFRGENGSTYSGPEPEYADSMILFDTEEHFQDATYELIVDSNNTYYADSYMTHQDMGHNIYIGVKGAESRMLTMSAVRVQGTTNVGFGLTAVNVSKSVADYYGEDVDVDLIRACM
jgi:hypothetical protein